MESSKGDKSIIIIGAGFAGLSAGIYALMNGYNAHIFEMHDKPGGLCTSWKRKGFTFDGCIHWLVGSSPVSQLYRFWEEVGIMPGREIINMDEFLRLEGPGDRNVVFYNDIERLEKSMLEFSPQDEKAISEFISGIKLCLLFDTPSGRVPFLKRLGKNLKMIFGLIINGAKMKKLMNTTMGEFAEKFSDPVLRNGIRDMWFPDFSILFMFFTFAYLHKRNAGYPIGGSLPMSYALEARFKQLGGVISYRKKVEKILVENNRASGVRLEDGTGYRSSRVISAADGYATIFKMLDGKYTDEKTREPYEKWKPFPPLIFASFGVNRKFDDIAMSVSGMSITLKQPVEIAEKVRDRIWLHIYNHDPSMAPAGKTSMTIMIESDYEYWKNLAKDRNAYDLKKEEITRILTDQLEIRFPGISSQIEVSDVATPLTFERYTGNWKGSFEGWLITPLNSHTMMKPMSQVLPGLGNFYMCGQWVSPGGGLPTGVITARKLIQSICREDHRKFKTI